MDCFHYCDGDACIECVEFGEPWCRIHGQMELAYVDDEEYMSLYCDETSILPE